MARGQETRGAVGERIRQARTERGLTPEALAERIGVTADALGGFEDGRSDPSRYLRRIAVATGKPVAWFAGTEAVSGRRRGFGTRLRGAATWLEEGQDVAAEALAPPAPAREAPDRTPALEAEIDRLRMELDRLRDSAGAAAAERDRLARELADVAERGERRASELDTAAAAREQEVTRLEQELRRREAADLDELRAELDAAAAAREREIARLEEQLEAARAELE